MEKNSSTQLFRFTAWRRVATVAVAATVALGTGACGLVKVGYRNGDTVGLFMMNRYLDLSAEQKEFVKPRLHALLRWHKTTQLPEYMAAASDLQKKAQQPITPAEVAALGEQSKRKAFATINHALPDMADIVLRLTPDNIRTLQAKLAEDDDKWRDDHMKGDPEKQQKARYEKSLERLEEWYGKFSRDQRAQIRQLSDARPIDNDVLFAERQRRQQDLIALLTRVEREKPSRDAVVAMMKTYAERFENSPDPERRAFLESLHRATDEMNAKIHNLATPQQRARASAKLQEWIDDFRSLAAEAA